ncbi:MAG: hypothetical protein ABSH50_32860 [Bryobacteraceae bacterium]
MLLKTVSAVLWAVAIACAQSGDGAYFHKNAYVIPNGSAFPTGITEGPDGAMWFTESGCYEGQCYIGRITSGGTLTQYAVPTQYASPNSITAGPDGALWFTESGAGQIGRITTVGAVTEYPVPASNSPNVITVGPDGALWFTEAQGGLGRITTEGEITEYPVSITTANQFLGGIATGPDGALWFTWCGFNGSGFAGVASMTTAGTVTSYQSPASYGPFNLAAEITAGSDGALWFADTSGNIWRSTTSGVMTQYPVPERPSGGGTGPVTLGPDGAVWFTVTCNPCATDWIGRVTADGVFTEYPTSRQGTLGGIAKGPGGSLWTTLTGFDLEIHSGLWRTPACGSGMNASYADGTVTVSFDLSTATAATWTVSIGGTTEIQKSLPRVAPPRAFTLHFDNIASQGDVLVESELADTRGELLCAEWETVNTGSAP